MNIFEVKHNELAALKARYDHASADEKEDLKKKAVAITEEIKGHGPAAVLIMVEYNAALNNGNSRLNIASHVYDAADVADCLRANDIKSFTCTWCTVETAWAFQQAGFKISGVVEVNGYEYRGGHEKLHAYLFEDAQ